MTDKHGWRDIDDEARSGEDVWAWRQDAGCFPAVYGACDMFSLTNAEIEEMSEDDYWQEDWWAYTQDGVARLEGDEAPTKYFPCPSPPEGE